MSKVYNLLTSATGTGAGEVVGSIVDSVATTNTAKRTFQAVGATSAGSGAVSVEIQCSNDGQNFLALATISLSLGTTVASDGFVSDAPWAFVRAKVVSISGTGAAVSILMGV